MLHFSLFLEGVCLACDQKEVCFFRNIFSTFFIPHFSSEVDSSGKMYVMAWGWKVTWYQTFLSGRQNNNCPCVLNFYLNNWEVSNKAWIWLFFLRSGSAESREIKISGHAVLNQSPNFKDLENMEVNKISMQLNLCVSISLILMPLSLLKYWSCGIDIADRGKKAI